MSHSRGTQPNQKVLIIDDEPMIHALVKARLVGERVDLFTAADGLSGIDFAVRLQPDLILLDAEMPVTDGFEVCRRLKEQPATWGIQIIFLSETATGEQKARGLDLGAVDYIAKPFDAAELRARVRASLRTKALLDLLATRSMIDGLTGLWNRNYFDRRLETELARFQRTGTPLSVIMIDVDRFKLINDRHGHPFGDRVLQQVAGVISGGCRAEDAACRYGGEEFAVIVCGADQTAAVAVAERLREQVRQIGFDVGEEKVTVTCSFGVAEASAESTAGMVERADRALYHAKQNGRNRVAASDSASITTTASTRPVWSLQ